MWFLVINTALALIPGLILVSFFYNKDKQKKEPRALIWKTFIIGFFSVLPALLLEILLKPLPGLSSGYKSIALDAFVVVGLVEEGIKLAVIMLIIFPRREFDEINDGIVYTITASMGFACFENIMYSFGPASTILIRGFTAVPLHAIASGIMGYYLGKTRCGEGNFILKGLFIAVMIHGFYDFCLFAGGAFIFLILPIIVIGGAVLLFLSKKALDKDRESGRS